MDYDGIKMMLNMVQNEVRIFCEDGLPTIDEVESFIPLVADMVRANYGLPWWNYEAFCKAIGNTVRSEILRACV